MPESKTKSTENSELNYPDSPKLPKSFLSTHAFLKNAYPFHDGKRVAKEIAIGAPSFLTGYIIQAAATKILFPHSNLFKTPVIDPPKKNPWWHHYLPLTIMINKKMVSPKTALCFHAPISEELFFRGLLMPSMQAGFQAAGMDEKPAKISSAIGNSLFFAALHPKTHQKAFFLTSLAYSALTYFANGSLIPATTGHMINNYTAIKLAEKSFGKK